MLDPVELVQGWNQAGSGCAVEIDDVRPVDHYGRLAWQAIARPTSSYFPRRPAGALLGGAADSETGLWLPDVQSEVRLDTETGICVFVRHRGRASGALDVQITAVDSPQEDHLFESSRSRAR
jgi:hypothetical protein